MFELLDTSPDANVAEAEYRRLLGFPRDYQPGELARARAAGARAWYREHGRPWIYGRQVTSVAVGDGAVTFDGVAFASSRMRATLAEANADAAVVVAVSAGAELEREAQRLWLEEKPDEYFFLEVFGSAVVEHLVTVAGARLCAWADSRQVAVLPHYSPGYPEWDIGEQPRLLEVLRGGGGRALPGPLEALSSGMLRPKKSLLAVFPLTRDLGRTRHLTTLVPCENCSYSPCQYRRVAYRRGIVPSEIDLPAEESVEEVTGAPSSPLTAGAKYSTNVKALSRWSAERLTLTQTEDGGVHALFRYEGSTCSNTGRPLAFLYRVTLSARPDGYRILSLACAPAPGDEGHRHMCRYLSQGENLLKTIAADKPLVNEPLDRVLSWERPKFGPTCYCDAESRTHKWGLVLETLHYALVQQEQQQGGRAAGATT